MYIYPRNSQLQSMPDKFRSLGPISCRSQTIPCKFPFGFFAHPRNYELVFVPDNNSLCLFRVLEPFGLWAELA